MKLAPKSHEGVTLALFAFPELKGVGSQLLNIVFNTGFPEPEKEGVP